MIKVKFSHFFGDNTPGDTADVNDDEARSLVDAGLAQYADPPEVPKKSATKGEWVAYATDTRVDGHLSAEQADAMTVAQIVAHFAGGDGTGE